MQEVGKLTYLYLEEKPLHDDKLYARHNIR